jgi:hypothetical protein
VALKIIDWLRKKCAVRKIILAGTAKFLGGLTAQGIHEYDGMVKSLRK